jgi:hypothetical protein
MERSIEFENYVAGWYSCCGVIAHNNQTNKKVKQDQTKTKPRSNSYIEVRKVFSREEVIHTVYHTMSFLNLYWYSIRVHK